MPNSNPTTPKSPTAEENAQSLLQPSTTLKLKIAWKEVEPVYQHVLKELSAKVKTAGFRQGKVPTVIARDIIGLERLLQETANHLLPAAYDRLIKESGKQPIAQPEFDPKNMGEGQDWEFEVKIAEKVPLSIKDHQKVAKKAKAEAEKLLEQEAKKPADPKATTPAKSLTANQRQERIMQEVLKALITTFRPRVPELLLKQETRYEIEDMVRSLQQLKMTLDDYLNRRRMDFDQFSNEVAVQTLGKLQLDLLYNAIIEEQKLAVTDQDLDAFVARIADEKARAANRKNEQYLRYITPIILRQKVSDYLLAL